ncbi:hypothetical protein AYK24_02745 [Thermoplasmatales archaeon SG8-52-4]|nr:MAG: hypothetical protein AYK24_02745 [Thermoplasmatales archaeon SG8-52-4]
MSLIAKKTNEKQKKGASPEIQEWDFPTTGDFDDVDGEKIEQLNCSITATCGASSDSFQMAGQTVSHAKKMLSPILNIDPDAAALVNGKEVNGNHILEKNDYLEFVKKAGEKGIFHCGE